MQENTEEGETDSVTRLRGKTGRFMHKGNQGSGTIQGNETQMRVITQVTAIHYKETRWEIKGNARNK